MPDQYGQVRPATVFEDAPVLRQALLEGNPIYFRLADGEGTAVNVLIGPNAGNVSSAWGARPSVDPAGFLVAIDRGHAYWFQMGGVLVPEYVQEKLWPDVRGWWYMAATLAVLLTAIRSPDEAQNAKAAADHYLKARVRQTLRWSEEVERWPGTVTA